MFVDIHTHNYNLDNQRVIKVVCLNTADFGKIGDIVSENTIYLSAGIHPWDVMTYNNEILESLLKIVKDKRVIAIGEVGLDRIHTETIEYQQQTFRKMIKLSEENHKPMIIHSVKTSSDIIFERKKSKATMPWIIHGFNGSLQTAQQLISHGLYISLGEILYRNENQAIELLNSISLENIFFESDVAERSIIDVYEKASTLMNCRIEDLEKMVFENFRKIFYDGKLEEQNADTRW